MDIVGSGLPNDFDDVGLPPNHTDGYFETNPNDVSYTYDNTARDMIVEEALGTYHSEQKDLIPKALHPDEFEHLQD